MPTVLDQLRHAFRTALTGLSPELYDADPLVVPTTNPAFGDYQCNAAMAAAKRLKRKPRDVAELLVAAVGDAGGLVQKLEIAGPGFINVHVSPARLGELLTATARDDRLGVARVESPQTIVVDYCGVNIAKEMHVGHLRSTIIGDAIARVFDFQGQHTVRQNHLGDWGTQFGMLITALRYPAAAEATTTTAGLDTNDLDIGDLDAFYRQARTRFDSDERVNGHSFADEARASVVRLQAGEADELAWWHKLVGLSQAHFRPLYRRMDTTLTEADDCGESFYNAMLPKVVADLKAGGQAVETDGAVGVFIDGPEKAPLLVQKSGGGYLYGTTDLAAVRYRAGGLHATRVLYFVDARQAQHFSQVFRVAKAAGWADGVSLEHAAFGTILGKDGKPFKTRTGDTIKLKDLLDEAEERAGRVIAGKSPDLSDAEKRDIAHAVGVGAVKYGDLSKDRTSDYVFDFDTMLAMDGNTAPYLQYAYVRVRSIFRKAEAAFTPGVPIALQAPQELALGKHLVQFGDAVANVSRDLKPHLLCQYLYDLATLFSGFFENCPVLKSDEPTRSQRLALCDLTARTLGVGLDLLGIEHPDRM